MWEGKNKAVTFSFDDGVRQDKQLVKILNKYGLKSTFNLNSALLGLEPKLECNGRIVDHSKVQFSEVKDLYKGHEVAVHTLTHEFLPRMCEEAIVYQVERDRLILSDLVGYEVVGMAYPNGGQNNDDRVAEIIKRRTGVKYSRTITATGEFLPQENLYRFNPTVHFVNLSKMKELWERFISEETTEDRVFYIWGHSYEIDAGHLSWDEFDDFCKMVSGRKDVFYGTNSEVLLNQKLYK